MPSGSRIVLRTAAEADIPTPAADQVALFMDADDGNAPAYKDELGVVTPLEGAPGADAPALTYLDHGNTGASEAVDVSVADVQRLVFNAATVTITTSGWPASGTPAICRLLVQQDVTGGRLASWPAAFTWGDLGAPTLQTAGGSIDVIDIESIDGGTTIIATLAGRRGATGAAGTNGTNGTTGGAIAIPYTFSTTTTDSDPGSGNLRLDNATQLSATKIRADLLSSDGTTWADVLDSFDDASNAVLGHIRLFKTTDPTKWIVFTVTSLATPSGYRNITVAVVAGSGANPFSNGDAITLTFTRAGDQGSTVGSGTLTTVEEVDGSPTDSAVTKLVLPNGTLAIAGHVATYTPAAGGITRSTVGTTSAGASFDGTRRVYMKKVTLASDGFIASIVVQLKGNANNTVAVTAAVFSDSAGTPSEVVATSGPIQKESDNSAVTNLLLNTTTRGVTIPIGYWAVAGDYWLAVCLNAAADSRISIAYAAGTGSDRTRAGFVFVDHAVLASSTSSDNYSIAANILR